MGRYALIDNETNICVNVIVWDGNTATWQPPDGFHVVESQTIEIGDEVL